MTFYFSRACRAGLPVVSRSLMVLLLSSLSLPSVAAPPSPIKLWPNGAPGDTELALPAQSTEVRGDATQITSNVSDPTLTFYPAPEADNTRAMVLVCPGGGYHVLANSHEGIDVCTWLNKQGIHAALLLYRVPRRPDREKHVAPLQDVQRAMTIIRSHAADWNLDADRVGILGFSAGGHLATMALTSDGKRTYPPEAVGGAEPPGIGCVPDFGVLVYPAYLSDPDDPFAISPEVKVTDTTPPTFIVFAHDDHRYVEGSARFYLQMLKSKRPCELHIFAKGGHGFGMRETGQPVAEWPGLALDWMKSTEILKPSDEAAR